MEYVIGITIGLAIGVAIHLYRKYRARVIAEAKALKASANQDVEKVRNIFESR